MTDHPDLAQHAFDAAALRPAPRSVTDALGYLQTLLALLPAEEHAGYLLKPAGDNIAQLADGNWVSVGRICYPDGSLVKVMSDVPNGGPQWAPEDPVDAGRYLAFAGTHAAPIPTPDRLTTAVWNPITASDLTAAIAQINAHSDANTEKIQQQIDQVVKNAEASAKALLPLFSGVTGLSALFGKKG